MAEDPRSHISASSLSTSLEDPPPLSGSSAIRPIVFLKAFHQPMPSFTFVVCSFAPFVSLASGVSSFVSFKSGCGVSCDISSPVSSGFSLANSYGCSLSSIPGSYTFSCVLGPSALSPSFDMPLLFPELSSLSSPSSVLILLDVAFEVTVEKAAVGRDLHAKDCFGKEEK